MSKQNDLIPLDSRWGINFSIKCFGAVTRLLFGNLLGGGDSRKEHPSGKPSGKKSGRRGTRATGKGNRGTQAPSASVVMCLGTNHIHMEQKRYRGRRR